MTILKIASEFSENPFGRVFADGPNSGERFREEVLKPRLAEIAPGEKLKIILDEGVESYGSSFLSAGFAGMIKFGYMTKVEFLNSVDLSYSDPDFEFYARKIKEYVEKSEYDVVSYTPTTK